MVQSLGTDTFLGVLLSVAEAATLGLPFEVVKTYMGSNRSATTVESVSNIYAKKGLGGFWNGLTPKLSEAALKGPVLIIAKDRTQANLVNYAGLSNVTAGYLGGFVGGISQTVVMAPLTFLVTRAVTLDSSQQKMNLVQLFREHGLKGLYSGTLPIALRQASNWSLRQGLNEFFRTKIILWRHGDVNPNTFKLSTPEEILAGILAGTCACINQPFEVARIEQQWRQVKSNGGPKLSTFGTLAFVYKERGIRGWYAALPPRIALSIWQTLFMVTFARFIRDSIK